MVSLIDLLKLTLQVAISPSTTVGVEGLCLVVSSDKENCSRLSVFPIGELSRPSKRATGIQPRKRRKELKGKR